MCVSSFGRLVSLDVVAASAGLYFDLHSYCSEAPCLHRNASSVSRVSSLGASVGVRCRCDAIIESEIFKRKGPNLSFHWKMLFSCACFCFSDFYLFLLSRDTLTLGHSGVKKDTPNFVCICQPDVLLRFLVCVKGI